MRRSSAKRSFMPPLTMSFSSIDAEHARRRRRRPAACRHAPRRRRSRSTRVGGTRRPAPRRWRRIASAAPLRIGSRPPSPGRSTPLMRVCAVNGTKVAPSRRPRAAQLELLLGEHDDARPLGVSSASEASCAASARSAVDAGRGMNARLAVAERDRAGLVEQQHVDVAGGLDGAARGGDHVGLHHAVHAGDRRSPTAARRSSSGSGTPAARRPAPGDRRPRRPRPHAERENGSSVTVPQEDDRQRASRMSARSRWASSGAAPSTIAIMRSRKVSPGLTTMRTTIQSRARACRRSRPSGRRRTRGSPAPIRR